MKNINKILIYKNKKQSKTIKKNKNTGFKIFKKII